MKKATCPHCGNKAKLGKKQPQQCDSCKGAFNVSVRTVRIRLKDFDPEDMERAFGLFAQFGRWFLHRLRDRMKGWQIVEKQPGICPGCQVQFTAEGKKRGLTMRNKDLLYCSTCGSDRLYGKLARKELMLLASEVFYIPRTTMAERALARAQSMFRKWLSQNWGRFIGLAKRTAYFEDKKAQARLYLEQLKQEAEKDTAKAKFFASEPTRILNIWASTRTSQCSMRFFQSYLMALAINQRHRKARRKRLHKLSLAYARIQKAQGDAMPKKKGKGPRRKPSLTRVAYHVAKPICGNDKCPHLERFDWGYQCNLHNRRLNPPPTRFPEFPSTIALMQKATYKVLPGSVKLSLFEKGNDTVAGIMGEEWLEEYGYPDFDTNAYPHLWHRIEGAISEYYLMYPLTTITKVKGGPWQHTIAFGPWDTAVVSIGDEGKRKVRFFNHGNLVSAKKYHQSVREATGKTNPERRLRRFFSLLHRQIIAIAGKGLDIPLVKFSPEVLYRHVPKLQGQEEAYRQVRNLMETRTKLAKCISASRRKGKLCVGQDLLALLAELFPQEDIASLGAAPAEPAAPQDTNAADGNSEEEAISFLPLRKPKRTFFKKLPRFAESRQVNAILHNEAASITQYIASFPGTVTMVVMGKTLYNRNAEDRRKYNQRLGRWPDFAFRQRMGYKPQLAGFAIQEIPFALSGLVLCPRCRAEAGGTWQDRLIVHTQRNLHCGGCGYDGSITLAMALLAKELHEKALKEKKPKKEEESESLPPDEEAA